MKKVRKLGIGKGLNRWRSKVYCASLTSYLIYKTFKIRMVYRHVRTFQETGKSKGTFQNVVASTKTNILPPLPLTFDK